MSRPAMLTAALLGLATAPAHAADGEALFTSKACTACHHVDKDQSTIGLGPSLKMIAGAYDGKKDDLVKFLSADPSAKPIVKPELYPIMQTQQAMTKLMSDDEKAAVADYILSNK